MTRSQHRTRMLRESERREKHQACPCGCGEMRDECPLGSNPMGAFRNPKNDPNPYHPRSEQ